MEVAPSALPPGVVVDGRQGHLVRSDDGAVTRYRYRANNIPSPVAERDERDRRMTHGHGLVESRMRGNAHVRFGGAGRGDGRFERSEPAPRYDPYLERVNGEIKRRTNVVGIFPNDAAIVRLLTTVCVETHDEWVVPERRHLSEESMSKLYETTTGTEAPLVVTA